MGWKDKVKPFGTEQGATAVASPPTAPGMPSSGWKSRVRPFAAPAASQPEAETTAQFTAEMMSRLDPLASQVDSGSTPAAYAYGNQIKGGVLSASGGATRSIVPTLAQMALDGNPAVTGGRLLMEAVTGGRQPTAIDTVAPVLAENLGRAGIEARQVAEIHAARSDYPEVTNIGSKVVGGLATQVPLGMMTGPAGMVAVNAAASHNDALIKGKDAGLEGADLQKYAATAGAIEGGTTLLFQGLNKLLPGAGGAEAIFGKGAAKLTVPQVLKRLGVGAAGELTEENSIALLDAWNDYLSRVDPNAVDKDNLLEGFRETSLVTLLTMGAMNAPAGARAVKGSIAASAEKKAEAAKPTLTPEAAAEWAAQPANQAAAAKVADAVDKGNPVSRAMMQAMGLPNLDAERRAKFGAWVKSAVDEMIATATVPKVEPTAPTTQPNVTPDANVNTATAATAAYEPAATGEPTITAPPQAGAKWTGDVTQDPAWLARREAGTNKPPPKKKSLRTAGPTDVTMSPEELGPQPKRVLGPMTPRMDVTATQAMPQESNPWEMTAGDLNAAIDASSSSEATLLKRVFGSRATEYETALKNKFYDGNVGGNAQRKLSQMYDSLGPKEKSELDDFYENKSPEILIPYRDAISQVNAELATDNTAEALGRGISDALDTISEHLESPSVDKMPYGARMAVAQMNEAARIAADNEWSMGDVIKHAATNLATKYRGNEDLLARTVEKIKSFVTAQSPPPAGSPAKKKLESPAQKALPNVEVPRNAATTETVVPPAVAEPVAEAGRTEIPKKSLKKKPAAPQPMPEPSPPATPPPAPLVAELAPDDSTTGVKHAKVDELRDKIGMSARQSPEPESFEQWNDAAAKHMVADPQWIPDLIEKRLTTPLALGAEETAGLGRYIRDLENRRQAGEDVRDELVSAIKVDTTSGTKAGQNLVARKMELYSDFSLAGLIAQHFKSVNENPTNEEMAKLEKQADKLAKENAELKAVIEKKQQEIIDLTIAEAKAKSEVQSPTQPKNVAKKDALKKQAADAAASFKKEWAAIFQLGAINDPRQQAEKWVKITKAAGNVVKAYAEMGVNSFLELMSRVKKDIGDITAEQVEAFKAAWSEYRSGQLNIPAAEKPGETEIGTLARQLTRWAVESGIEEREAVVDAVHSELGGMGVELTRSQVMEAMSGYGDYRELSKDEVSVKVRGIRGELQQLLKLEDMQAGKAPKATGVERRKPSDNERDLIKQVNEAKKKGGYVVTDPARQLKSAEDATKTALLNRIKDLTKENESREKIVKERTVAPPSVEVLALRNRRDELLEENKKIFPPKKTVQTAAQKLRNAEQAADRQIAHLKADLAAGQLGPKQPGTPLTSAALEAKKAEIAALQELRNRARAIDPAYQAKQAEKLLDAAKAVANKRLAELQEAITTRTKPVDNSKQVIPDAELIARREQIAKLKEEYDKIFPKQKADLTDAQRMKMAERALDNQIAKIEADLAAGNLLAKDRAQPLTSPEIEAKRQRLAELQQARDLARATDPAYQSQQAAKQDARYKKSLENRLKFWEKRREDARGGILPAKRVKLTPTDKAVLDKMLQIERTKSETLALIEESRRKNLNIGQKAWEGLNDVVSLLPRTMMAGLEMSVVGLQGFVYSTSHPVKAFSNLLDSLRSIVDERYALAIKENIDQRTNYRNGDYSAGKVDFTVENGPKAALEDINQSSILRLIKNSKTKWLLPPRAIAQAYSAFERGYRTYANTAKADMFDIAKADTMGFRDFFDKHFGKFGYKSKAWSEEDNKTTGRAVNILTGRGTGLQTGGLTNFLLYAPRWTWSRIQTEIVLPFQMLTPKAIGQWNADPAMRVAFAKLYLQSMVGTASMYAMVYWALKLAADDEEHEPEIGTDITSTDFGKIKVGDTRINMMGGFQQPAVLGARILLGAKTSGSGRTVDIRGEDADWGGGSVYRVMGDYARTKFGPGMSLLTDIADGQDVAGNKKSAGEMIVDRLTPMTYRDVLKAEEELNWKQGAIAGILAFFGAGVGTYGVKTQYADASPEDRAKIDKSLMRAADELARVKPMKTDKREAWEADQSVAHNKLKAIGRTDEQLSSEYWKYLQKEIEDPDDRRAKYNRFKAKLRQLNAAKP